MHGWPLAFPADRHGVCVGVGVAAAAEQMDTTAGIARYALTA